MHRASRDSTARVTRHVYPTLLPSVAYISIDQSAGVTDTPGNVWQRYAHVIITTLIAVKKGCAGKHVFESVGGVLSVSGVWTDRTHCVMVRRVGRNNCKRKGGNDQMHRRLGNVPDEY